MVLERINDTVKPLSAAESWASSVNRLANYCCSRSEAVCGVTSWSWYCDAARQLSTQFKTYPCHWLCFLIAKAVCKLEPSHESSGYFLFHFVTAFSCHVRLLPQLFCVIFFSQKLVKKCESVDGKNLTMFSFEGDFRRRPKVSLGGASKKASVIWLWGEVTE